MDKGFKLPYLRARTSKKALATPLSSPDVGIIGHHNSSGKLRPLTKDLSREDPTCNTVYVAAVRPTSSCSQRILEEPSDHLMEVEASRSDDMAQS